MKRILFGLGLSMMIAGAAMVGGMWAASADDQADGQDQAEHQWPGNEASHAEALSRDEQAFAQRERIVSQADERIQRLDQIAGVLRDEDFPELAEQADWQARRLEGRMLRDLQQHQLDQVAARQKELRRVIEKLREEVLELRREISESH